jgi:hypothetical protein
MPTLSYQEKCLYAEFFGTIAFVVFFFIYADSAGSSPGHLSRSLVAYAVVYFAVSFLASRGLRFKRGDYRIDERDWQIESRGIRAAYNVLSLGIIWLIVRFWDAPSLTATRIFDLLVALIILASLARMLQMLRLYRSGL